MIPVTAQNPTPISHSYQVIFVPTDPCVSLLTAEQGSQMALKSWVTVTFIA